VPIVNRVLRKKRPSPGCGQIHSAGDLEKAEREFEGNANEYKLRSHDSLKSDLSQILTMGLNS